VSDELRRRGIPLRQRLRVVVESIDAEEPSVTAMTAAGGAFDWLAEEPDLYSDADLVERFRSDRNCFWGILARDRSAASPSHPVFRHTLRLHDGHDCIGGVGEEFTVTLEFVEASWGRDCISVRAH
jgi:hypothetical protein